jgi:hypothetical protein
MVDWCYLGEKRFTEPFFDDTINRCLRHPFNALFRHQPPIRRLEEWGHAQPGIPHGVYLSPFPVRFYPHRPDAGRTARARSHR